MSARRAGRVSTVLNLTAEQWDALWWTIQQDAIADGADEQASCYMADADMVEQFGPRPADGSAA